MNINIKLTKIIINPKKRILNGRGFLLFLYPVFVRPSFLGPPNDRYPTTEPPLMMTVTGDLDKGPPLMRN